MRISPVNIFFNNIRPQGICFKSAHSGEKPQVGDTFQKSDKPKEFYTLSKMAHAGQAAKVEELLKKPRYSPEALKQLLVMQDRDGRTPLHKAVRGAGFENILKTRKPGELEAMFPNDEAIKKKLKEIAVIRENAQQYPQYLRTIQAMLAPFKDDPKALKEIFTVLDFEGQTPLSEAARSGVIHTQMLHHFEKHPKALKEVFLSPGYGQRTLLHTLACEPEKQKLISELIKPFKNDIEALKELLMAKDWRGNTPLHLAIKGGDTGNIGALLKPLENDSVALKELLMTKNDRDRAPFELITYYKDDEVSQIVESYIKIVTDADK